MKRNNTLSVYRLLEVFIHLISWGIIFGFPFFFLEHKTGGAEWSMYLRHMGVPLSFMLVFYVNYFLLVPRFLFEQRTKRFLLVNLLFLIVVGLLLHVWQSLNFTPSLNHGRQGFPPGWIFFTRDMLSLVLTAGLSAAIRMSGRWRQAESARQEAEKSRTEAELNNLRNQLNPHFLLNTLNNIYALIAFDSVKAQQAVQELSKLLRYVLYDNRQMYVPLAKEVDFICNYIELMRIRLSADVMVTTHFDLATKGQTLIAPLLFISLIENAFKHGVSPTEHSLIHIALTEGDGEVICEITNTNFPKSDADKSGSGIGLEQVKKRLELLYPHRYRWERGVIEQGKIYSSKLILQIKE